MAGGAVAVGGNAASVSQGRLTPTLVMVCITAAFGGLMFGYEIGIAGGAIAMAPFLQKFFPDIYESQENFEATKYCKYDDAEYQVIISSLFLVGAFVSLLSPALQRNIGRKWTMFISSIFFLGGSALLTFAESVGAVVMGRVLWGCCLGFANSSVPLYLSEMAPGKLRGSLNILFQLATTIGIWCAAILNWGIVEEHDTPNDGWRYSFGMSVVPGSMMFFGSLLLPNTPASLIELGKPEEARRVLQRVRGSEYNVEPELKSMVSDIERAKKETPTMAAQLRLLSQKPYLPSLVICLTMPFLQQFTGINSIMFYSVQLFDVVGVDSPFTQTMILQSVNCLTTFVAIALCDYAGRKFLLSEGAIQMAVALVITAGLVGSDESTDNDTAASFTIFFMCFFVAGFAWSWGPLAWLVPTEITAVEVRSLLFSIATWSNFIFTFVIGQCFNSMMCEMEYGVYLFFALFCLVALFFTGILLPETKGLKLEDVTELLRNHYIWHSCFTGTGGKMIDLELGPEKRLEMNGANIPGNKVMPSPSATGQATPADSPQTGRNTSF